MLRPPSGSAPVVNVQVLLAAVPLLSVARPSEVTPSKICTEATPLVSLADTNRASVLSLVLPHLLIVDAAPAVRQCPRRQRPGAARRRAAAQRGQAQRGYSVENLHRGHAVGVACRYEQGQRVVLGAPAPADRRCCARRPAVPPSSTSRCCSPPCRCSAWPGPARLLRRKSAPRPRRWCRLQI